jgi:hypothetical protein
MGQKPLISCRVILDASHNRYASASQLKSLQVYREKICLARRLIHTDQMMSRRIVDGCIQFWDGEENVRFAVQGFDSRGRADWYLTELLDELLGALCDGDQDEAAASLIAFFESRRALILRNFILVACVIGFCCTVPLLWFVPGVPSLVFDHPLLVTGCLLITLLCLVSSLSAALPRVIWKSRFREMAARLKPDA